MNFIKTYFSRKELYFLAFLSVLFFITRLYNILHMPVFVDEGNYIVWAKQAIVNKSYFITLTDGKPPIPTWLAMAFIYFTQENMLLGLRLSSVFSGLLATIGFFILNCQLFNKRTAFIGTLLYILTPFIVLYDRLGVVDSLANATSIFVLITSILLAQKRTLRSAVLFGIACGIGLLVKSNIWIPIYMSFLAPLIIYKKGMKFNKFISIVIRFVALYFVSLAIAQLLFRIQLLAPYPNAFELISNKNSDFLYNYHEILADPIGIFWKNVPVRINNLIHMTGWITFFVCIVGFIHLFLKKKLLAVYLFLWFTIPLFVITYLVKYFFARYMIFLATLIILMTGYFISNIKNKSLAIKLGIFILFIFICLDYPIAFKYQDLYFPKGERDQYVEGIASGYGIKEIVAFANEESKEKPVLIIGEGIFGLGSYIVESAVPMNDSRIEVTGLWPFNKESLKTFQPQLKNKKIFVVLNHQTVKTVPSDWPLKHVKDYKKPYDTDFFSLYELTN